jgi:molybdopterin-guanine dinucleotide biosynthesis protein A
MTEITVRSGVDASIAAVKLPMPAAVLAGGASKRMGRPKAALPWGAGTLLEFQTTRLSTLFSEVFVVVKEKPAFPVGPAHVILDGSPEFAAIHGLLRALEEAADRIFILAVDLPGLTHDLVREIADRGLATVAPALIPEAGGRLQPLAAVWRQSAARFAKNRIGRGMLSLGALADEVAAEIFPEKEWRHLDPSGVAFANLNTFADFAAHRERA